MKPSMFWYFRWIIHYCLVQHYKIGERQCMPGHFSLVESISLSPNLYSIETLTVSIFPMYQKYGSVEHYKIGGRRCVPGHFSPVGLAETCFWPARLSTLFRAGLSRSSTGAYSCTRADGRAPDQRLTEQESLRRGVPTTGCLIICQLTETFN